MCHRAAENRVGRFRMILQSLAGLPAFLVYFIVKIPVPNLSARIAAGEMASAIGLDCRRWRRARSTRRR